MANESVAQMEKPQNGLAGLKHWRYDIVSGAVVALISLPFSLGIAVASDAPPITGITSAVIAGLVLPFLGGSFVTISGPAAGLAPVLSSGMKKLAAASILSTAAVTTLPHNNDHPGYAFLLIVIFFTGIVQIILYACRAARFAAIFPASVVEGMLCAIGLLIIAKQLPHLLGLAKEFKTDHIGEFWDIVHESVARSRHMVPKVFGLGVFSLALIFWLGSIKAKWLKVFPPQVITAIVGALAGIVIGIDGEYLINIPGNPLDHIHLPPFQAFFSQPIGLWLVAAQIVLVLAMIDGVESLATIAAVDRIDHYKRKSDPNKTLLAMGVSNIASSAIGGLTIIPGGVKSTANIMGGGRTQWANFYNACFLMFFLLFCRPMINSIPYCVLAAILIFTGFKLCRPAVWRHVTEIGGEQLAVFGLTTAVTVSTDLLVGIFAGIGAKLLLNACFASSIDHALQANGFVTSGQHTSFLAAMLSMFKNPITKRELKGTEYHLYAGRPLVCFNALPFNHELENIPPEATSVKLHMDHGMTMIDHTTCDNLINRIEETNRAGNISMEIIGMDRLMRRSYYHTAMHTLDVEQTTIAGTE